MNDGSSSSMTNLPFSNFSATKDGHSAVSSYLPGVHQATNGYSMDGQGLGRGEFDLYGDVPPEPQNPYPFLGVIFAKKGTHF